MIQQQVIIHTGKSVGTAAVLGFLFAPLGMLYSTILGAVVMFFVALVAGVATLGFGLFIVWPICGVWAALAADAKNSKLRHGVSQTIQHSGVAAGWYQDSSGSDRLRWWDGQMWTSHYAPDTTQPGIEQTKAD